MRLSLELDLRFSTKTIRIVSALAGFVVLVAIILFVKHLASNRSPLPQDIKKQVSFAVAYPKKSSSAVIDQSSYSYQPDEKTLMMSINDDGSDLTVTEQPAPNNPQDNSLVYYQSLGLHPVVQIDSNNGLAVLVNFYQSGNLNQEGRNGIIVKNGTLVIVHPDKDLTNEQWKSFFDNLTISK